MRTHPGVRTKESTPIHVPSERNSSPAPRIEAVPATHERWADDIPAGEREPFPDTAFLSGQRGRTGDMVHRSALISSASLVSGSNLAAALSPNCRSSKVASLPFNVILVSGVTVSVSNLPSFPISISASPS